MNRWFVVIVALHVLTSSASAQPAGKVQFGRDVLPILASHCFTCHGPDAKTIKGGLRLDLFETATKKLKSGSHAVVPGNVKASELLTRIFADDENERMPPKSAKKSLTEKEKRLLERWIAEGAEYQRHWA